MLITYRKALAEALGAAMLIFFGVGSAVMAGDRIGVPGIALTFGLVLVALVYTLGPISGGHFNPAVTFGVYLAKRITLRTAVEYWIAQVVGGIVAGLLLKILVSGGKADDSTGNLGANNWAHAGLKGISTGGAFSLEMLLTFLLVFVVLKTTGRKEGAAFAGLAIGLSLAVIHMIGVKYGGASVNPARSIGPAIFSGKAAMEHLWLYIIAPLAGAALAAGGAWLVSDEAEGGEGAAAPAQRGAPAKTSGTRPARR
jgi:aquaporin Z